MYTILSDTDREALEASVNKHITCGWEPLGGVTVAATSTNWRQLCDDELQREYTEVWCQAMVKR